MDFSEILRIGVGCIYFRDFFKKKYFTLDQTLKIQKFKKLNKIRNFYEDFRITKF